MKYVKRKDSPGIIFVDKATRKIYQFADGSSGLDLENPLSGISLLLYKFVSETATYKQYHLKDTLR